jgi:hypothetical protein
MRLNDSSGCTTALLKNVNCIDWRDSETAYASRDGAAAQNQLLFATYLTQGNPGHVKNSQPLPDSGNSSFYFRMTLSIGRRMIVSRRLL